MPPLSVAWDNIILCHGTILSHITVMKAIRQEKTRQDMQNARSTRVYTYKTILNLQVTFNFNT